jgi:stage V sporulation protein G
MEITNVSVRKISNESSLKGEATVTIGGDFAIHGIKIIDGKKGVFVSMPNRKGKNKEGGDEYFDVAHPTTKEARKQLVDAVLGAYKAISAEEPAKA